MKIVLLVFFLLVSPCFCEGEASKSGPNRRFGEIKALSKLAKSFMRASGCDLAAEAVQGEVQAACQIARVAILAKATKLSKKAKKDAAKLSAKFYIKAMSSVQTKGATWIDTEYARVVGMLAKGKMSQTNVENFKRKRNILAVFSRQLPKLPAQAGAAADAAAGAAADAAHADVAAVGPGALKKEL